MKPMAALVLAAVLVGPAHADEAVYAVRGDRLPVDVAANGYVQTTLEGADGWLQVRVSTSSAPVGASGIWTSVGRRPGDGVPPDFVLPARLDGRLGPQMSTFAAAGEIIDWVRRSVRIDDRDSGPQDATSVLGRRRGRCSGIANLTAALLLSAGFEARTVSGLLIGDAGPVPHRWIECRLPGAGWVPTDPTLGRWVITARHMAFADAVDRLPEVRLVSAKPAEPRPPVDRVNRGAELSCMLIGGDDRTSATAVLLGPGGDVRCAVLEPSGRFTGLQPGRWVLEVRIADVLLERQTLRLKADQSRSLAIRVPQPAREVGS
jgi:hypothetical protein